MTTITVLCGEKMLRLLPPIEHSKTFNPDFAFTTGHGGYVVAVYDEATLTAVSDAAIERAGTWWRHTIGLLCDVPYREKQLLKLGLILYIYEVTGLSSLKHIAGAVMDLARNAGKDPVEFMNWCVDNAPARSRGARSPSSWAAGR